MSANDSNLTSGLFCDVTPRATTQVLKTGEIPLSIGLIALLDDIAAIAKAAAASLDDVVTQAANRTPIDHAQ